jgi:hypothetical protein
MESKGFKMFQNYLCYGNDSARRVHAGSAKQQHWLAGKILLPYEPKQEPA